MVKTYVPDQLLAEWFIKFVLPSITEDVAKGGVVTKEKVISRAQYLYLIYSQSGTLYDKIPRSPRLAFTIPPPPSSKGSHSGDSVIGSSSTQTKSRPSSQTLSISNQTSNRVDNTLSSEINVMSSDKGKNQKQPGGKKKGKNKKKKDNSPQEKSSDYSTSARKPCYPCLIYNDEHFIRDFPHLLEVSKLLKTSNTSAVLTNPFPNPETHLVVKNHYSTSQVLMLPITKPQNKVLV